jgi:CO/xanthine dehydrogenase FAD-binding subunit
MKAFDYLKPKTLEEALTALNQFRISVPGM